MTGRGFSKIWIIVMALTITAGGVLVGQNLEVIKFKLSPGIPMQPTSSYTPTSTSTFSLKSCTKKEKITEKTSEDEAKTQLTLETLKNAEYYCEYYDKKVQLKNGRYIKEYPDTVCVLDIGIYDDIATFGDLNNDGQEDAAVILDSSGGGSGHFYELAVVINQNGNPHYLTSELLGDRIKINSLTIQSEVIIIDMIVQGPNDAMCCPTMKKIAKYKLSGNQLLEVAERP